MIAVLSLSKFQEDKPTKLNFKKDNNDQQDKV